MFLANVFAIFLQSLCVKLGSVTGVDLATNCKRHLPRWLNISIYLLAEAAIIATDLAEVLGTAIALNILLHIPLVAGVCLTMADVLLVLYLYRPTGPLKAFRYFELGISLLVLGVVICLCIELSKLQNTPFAEVMRGYLPSRQVATAEGLYLSCGILGATVMPHSLYLGSGIVQPRIRAYDQKHGHYPLPSDASDGDVDSLVEKMKYRPSLAAIRNTMAMCIADVTISLATAALFVNSAILIVASSALSHTPGAADADLFSIHDLLSTSIGAAAGTVFALALLLSGQSSGIVVTLAGQMVCEGHLDWSLRPWIRRVFTRAIAVAPCVAVAAALGRDGISRALNASQVTLSILLPFLIAPLVWFTCWGKGMRVPVVLPEQRGLRMVGGGSGRVGGGGVGGGSGSGSRSGSRAGDSEVSGYFRGGDGEGAEVLELELERQQDDVEVVDLRNGKVVTTLAVVVWMFIAGMNVYLIVELIQGKGG